MVLTRLEAMSSKTASNTGEANGATMAAMAGTGEQSGVTPGGSDQQQSSGAGNPDLAQQLAKIMATQQQILGRIDKTGKDLKSHIASEIAKVRNEVFQEIAQVTSRLEALETSLPRQHEPFAPDVSVIIANMPMLAPNETQTQLLQKVNDVVANGLSLPGIEVVAVTRRAGRGRSPGLVIVELASLDDKKTVLRAKMNLRTNDAYKNLYVRSAEGHTDRLIRLNFQTLLDHLHLTRSFRLTGSGRLVPRNATGSGSQASDTGNRRPESADRDTDQTNQP